MSIQADVRADAFERRILSLFRQYLEETSRKLFGLVIYPRETSRTRSLFRSILDARCDVSPKLAQCLEEYTRNSLAKILNWSRRHSPHYCLLFDRLGIEGPISAENSLELLNRLPMNNKAGMREKMPEMVSVGYPKLLQKRLNTGGSTGEPLEFPGTRLAGLVDSIHHEEIYRLFGYRFGDRIISVDGTHLPNDAIDRQQYWTKLTEKQIPFGSVHFSAHYLTPETAPYYVAGIREICPAFIRGYPSALNEIAISVMSNSQKLRSQVKAVILTSENILLGQMEAIREAFHCPVVLQYGLTEMCAFAYALNSSEEYCFSPLYSHIEILKPDGKPAEPGETGEIVATGYFCLALPFIRYQTGDMAVLKSRSSGIVRVSRLLGRSQDILFRKDGSSVFVTSIVFGQHFLCFGRISQWQIEQFVPGEIIVNIVPAQNFSPDDEEEIRVKFRDNAGIQTSFRYLDEIKRTRSGKTPFVINHCL